jgi:hypothetical protein
VNAIEIRVSGSVTPTASITVGYFRAKAGDRVYFESAVSPPFDVQAGRSVSITMTVNASIRYRFNVGGGLSGDIYSISVEFMYLLYTALSGRRPHDGYLTLERVDWADENINFLLSRELVRSYSPGATSGSASHDYANFMASGNLRYVFVQCTGSPECIIFSFPEAVSVTTADRARFSIVIDVGYSFDLSDSLSLGLDDSWSLSVGFNFGLSDDVSLGLVDSWENNFVSMSLGGFEVVRTDGEVVDASLGVGVVRVDGQVVDMGFGVGAVRVDGQVVNDFRFGLEYIIS